MKTKGLLGQKVCRWDVRNYRRPVASSPTFTSFLSDADVAAVTLASLAERPFCWACGNVLWSKAEFSPLCLQASGYQSRSEERWGCTRSTTWTKLWTSSPARESSWCPSERRVRNRAGSHIYTCRFIQIKQVEDLYWKCSGWVSSCGKPTSQTLKPILKLSCSKLLRVFNYHKNLEVLVANVSDHAGV